MDPRYGFEKRGALYSEEDLMLVQEKEEPVHVEHLEPGHAEHLDHDIEATPETQMLSDGQQPSSM